MKKLKLTALLAAFIGASAIFFAACSNSSGGGDNQATPPSSKTIYVASSNLSDYTSRIEKKLGNFSRLGNISGDQAPDVFIVSGNDAQSLSDSQTRLAVLTCLQGKTLVFDAPTLEHVAQFKTKVDSVLQQEKNAKLKAESLISPYSPYHFTEKATHAQEGFQSSSSQEKPYDAIAARKDDFYIVYDVDKPMERKATPDGTANTWPDQGAGEDEDVEDDFTPSDQSAHETYERLISDSTEKFAKWISDSETLSANTQKMDDEAIAYLQKNVVQNADQAALEIKKRAQVERRNFTAEFFIGEKKYPRYNGCYDHKRKENVEITIYVWSVCDIANQKDWYLVKTSSTCRNDQLNWDTADWGGRFLKVSPYFSFYSIDLEMCSSAGVLDQAAPDTSTGSSSFTSGVSTNISGTFGANVTPSYGTSNGLGISGGFSGSVSTGITFSESTTTNIPDVSVTYTKKGDRKACWNFATPRPTAEDLNKGKSLKYYMRFNGLRPIQKNTATFETLAIFSVPSGDTSLDRNHIRLHLWSQICQDIYCGEYSKSHKEYADNIYGAVTSFDADIHIEKPCNAYRTYVMGFTPPEGSNTTDLANLDAQLTKKCAEPDKQLWVGSATYYAVVTAAEYANETEKNKRLDEVAKAQFALVKNKILNNKSVFHDVGFKGKYTFYIQANDKDRQDQFDVDFGQ